MNEEGLPKVAGEQDPRPEPPEKLLPGDCCDSGCARCVRDVYMDQRAAYRKALAAWEQRHPELATGNETGAGKMS